MKKFFSLFATILLLGCSDAYDDSTLVGRVDDLENRVERLEELCGQLNSNIESLQTIVDALQKRDYVTAVEPIKQDGEVVGYTISFANNDDISIYNGKDGKDGEDGKDGAAGEDGYTPQIGVRADSDGIYYWTLDGEWLLDDAGNKIKAVGTDGKDGITPQLKIEDGNWYILYNEAKGWELLGKATGEDGDSFFSEVREDEKMVYFHLADGSVIELPKAVELSITFKEDDIDVMQPYSNRVIHFTVNSSIDDVLVEVVGSSSARAMVSMWDAATKEGEIYIEVDEIDSFSKVIVFVSNGERVIMHTIAIETYQMEVQEGSSQFTLTDGGEMDLYFVSNAKPYVELWGCDWLTVEQTQTRSLEPFRIVLQAQPNTGEYRVATVTVHDQDWNVEVSYTVSQRGVNPNSEITYTGKGMPTLDYGCHYNYFDASTGEGIMCFEQDVTVIAGEMRPDRMEVDYTQNLETITYPSTVSYIYTHSLMNNYNLREVTYLSVTPPQFAPYSGAFGIAPQTIIYVPEGSEQAYREAERWSLYAEHIFSRKEASTLYYTSTTSQIVEPTNVDAFGGAKIVSNSYIDGEGVIVFDKVLTTIGERAFEGNQTLSTITFKRMVNSIGTRAFADCQQLVELTFESTMPPAGGEGMFDNINADAKINIPFGSQSRYLSAQNWMDYSSMLSYTEGTIDISMNNIEAYTFLADITLSLQDKHYVVKTLKLSEYNAIIEQHGSYDNFVYVSSIASLAIGQGSGNITDALIYLGWGMGNMENHGWRNLLPDTEYIIVAYYLDMTTGFAAGEIFEHKFKTLPEPEVSEELYSKWLGTWRVKPTATYNSETGSFDDGYEFEISIERGFNNNTLLIYNWGNSNAERLLANYGVDTVYPLQVYYEGEKLRICETVYGPFCPYGTNFAILGDMSSEYYVFTKYLIGTDFYNLYLFNGNGYDFKFELTDEEGVACAGPTNEATQLLEQNGLTCLGYDGLYQYYIGNAHSSVSIFDDITFGPYTLTKISDEQPVTQGAGTSAYEGTQMSLAAECAVMMNEEPKQTKLQPVSLKKLDVLNR